MPAAALVALLALPLAPLSAPVVELQTEQVALSMSASGDVVGFMVHQLARPPAHGTVQPYLRIRSAARSVPLGPPLSDEFGAIVDLAVSGDGRWAVVETQPRGPLEAQLVAYEVRTGRWVPVSVTPSGDWSDDEAGDPTMSGDGRYVAFSSRATDLGAPDRDGTSSVYVRDLRTGVTRWVSRQPGHSPAHDDSALRPAISANGRWVAFTADADNLVPGDTNGHRDVFVRDLVTGRIELVSVDSRGRQGDEESDDASISADGRWIAFRSFAGNLAPGDRNGVSDVFVRDTWFGTTHRVSVGSRGEEGNEASWTDAHSLSPDGRWLVFSSIASTLTPGGSNRLDVYVRDLRYGTTQRATLDRNGRPNPDGGILPLISAGGRWVAFYSESTELVQPDTPRTPEAFIRDRWLHRTERLTP